MIVSPLLRPGRSDRPSRRGIDPAHAVRRQPARAASRPGSMAEYADTVRSTTRRTARRRSTPNWRSRSIRRPRDLRPDRVGRRSRGAQPRRPRPLGPGYHRFVGRLVERLGDELSIIVWTAADDGLGRSGTTFADRPVAERAYLGWLGPTLVRARDGRARRGATSSRSGSRRTRATPSTARSRRSSGRATTRGSSRPSPTRASPSTSRRGGPTRPTAGYLLNRALTLMWLDVRWRTPADHGGARAPGRRSTGSCLGPIRSDPTLPTRGTPGPSSSRCAASTTRCPARSSPGPSATAEPAAPIGYRRDPVTITPRGLEPRDPRLRTPSDGPPRSGGAAAPGGRSRWPPSTARHGGAMGAQAFVDQFGGDLGPDAIDHRAGGVVGRARLSTDAELRASRSASSTATRRSSAPGAAIRIVFDDPGDWQWALDMWRSLAPG